MHSRGRQRLGGGVRCHERSPPPGPGGVPAGAGGGHDLQGGPPLHFRRLDPVSEREEGNVVGKNEV